MTKEPGLSGPSRSAVVFVSLLMCGTFVAAINDTVGLVVMASAPAFAAVQVLGYPKGPDSVRSRLR